MAEGGAPVRELEDFVQMFKRTRQVAGRSPCGVAVPADALASRRERDLRVTRARDLLTQRVVSGSSSTPLDSEAANASLQDFMRELERWSMELQRHCPEDWNQCSAILVQCLADGSEKEGESPA